MFVGSPGARSFFTNPAALRIAREANHMGGAAVQRPGVVSDGNTITASGPEFARAFGMAIVRALSHAARAAAATADTVR